MIYKLISESVTVLQYLILAHDACKSRILTLKLDVDQMLATLKAFMFFNSILFTYFGHSPPIMDIKIKLFTFFIKSNHRHKALNKYLALKPEWSLRLESRKEFGFNSCIRCRWHRLISFLKIVCQILKLSIN